MWNVPFGGDHLSYTGDFRWSEDTFRTRVSQLRVSLSSSFKVAKLRILYNISSVIPTARHSTPARQMHILGIVRPSGKQLVLFRKKDLLGRAFLVLGGLRIRIITTLTGRYSTEPTQWDRLLPPSAISAFRDVFDSVGRT